MASFWGIGVGPGDSELLTVKAVEAIKNLDVLYTPQAHKGGPSVAEKIVSPYLPSDLKIKQRHFPMVNDLAEKQQSWQKIADEIVSDVQSGLETGFLTLGDPSVYSTYSYITDLVDSQVKIVTIAGISSYSQIAASLSIPLMLDEEALEIVPATVDRQHLEQAIDLNENVVIMKIATHFQDVYELLESRGLLDNTVVVEKSSMDGEVIRTLSEYRKDDKLPYFSTAIMKRGKNYGTN